ncbi:MAG TPA: PAS domain-containing protein [Terrimicrobiaceae bacterium]
MSMPSDNQTSHLQGLRRQADILERIARGIPLPETLERLALMIESEGGEIRCGICVVDPNHGIVTGSFGPNLPTSFSRSLLGVDLKESAAGPCASAACKRETITVENIAADTRWIGTPWRDNCLEHGFQRCQSSPIMDSTGRIIGTFAVYFRRSDGRRSYPELSETAAHLASIAIERDRDEAALRDSKERLQLAVEGADLGTWDWNLRNDKLHWSDRCKRMFGIPSETKMTYQRFLAAVHPDDREHVDRVTQDSLRNRTTCSLEFRCVWPDHTVRWIAIIGKGSYSRDSASPLFMRGVTIDITERKQAQMLAAESVQRFRFLGDALPEKIFTATPDGEIDYLNDRWSAYTGVSLQEVLRLGWRGFVHPDDLEEKVNRWSHAIRTGAPFEFEHRFRRADGAYRWHLSRAQPMRRSDGTVSMWVGSNTDVDDLKRAQFDLRESEGRGRLAMEAAGLGFWDWDIGKTVKWSPEHNRMLGIPPEIQEGSFELFINHIHPEDRDIVMRALERAKEQRMDFEAEFRSTGNDGSIRWLSGHGRAYYDEQTGRPVRMIGVMRDITERKKSEVRLRANQEELRAALAAAELAREQAEAAAHAKDQFLAVLSHELRTPLTPVLMAVSAIGVQKSLPADVREALNMIQRNIKIEARLIEDLLDLTRITRNKVQLYLEPVDLHVALEQAMETCRSDIETKKQRVHSNLAAQNSRVNGDFARLQQVFWNLVKNAVKFTGEGGEIFIQSYNKDSQIFVAVSDTGVGIVPEVMSRIFNPFEQGEPGSVRQFGGLGLGLAISKATMEAHHGTLTARSKGRNQGATFTVGLAIVR